MRAKSKVRERWREGGGGTIEICAEGEVGEGEWEGIYREVEAVSNMQH